MRRRASRRTSSLALALAAGALVTAPQTTGAAPTGYVGMSDGVMIAVNVRLPDTYVAGSRYPAVFEMSGYDGGSAHGQTLMGDIGDVFNYPNPPLKDDSRSEVSFPFNVNYVTVHASVRGTGCSGGEFDLFNWRTALDGYELIEWIGAQSWSNGDVGIIGHSYGGITGFMVAATQPPSLKAASLSGLIDDLYRGMVYPGGVSNYGFPLLWTAGVRNAYDLGGGLAPGLVRPPLHDPDNVRSGCVSASATKSRTVLNDPIVQGIADTDNDWWRARALSTHAHLIDVPIHITGAYQDEQTGPRFPRLFEMVDGVPARLLLSNGDHGVAGFGLPEVREDRVAWVDHWMRGIDGGFGDLEDADRSVRVLLETGGPSGHYATLSSNGALDRNQFPLEDTEWRKFYFRCPRPRPLDTCGGNLSPFPPIKDPPFPYISGSPRQSYSWQAGYSAGQPLTTAEGLDELTFRSWWLEEDLLVAGPITATLYVSTTAPDTEIFVQLIEEWEEGGQTYRRYLQRGLLKASHRAIDLHQSDCVNRLSNERVACTAPGAHLYRPHRPHTNPTPIEPGQVHELLVEVFPVGHVFREGHRIVVKIHAPPAADSYYAYVPRGLTGINTLYAEISPGGTFVRHWDSHITLPVVPLDGVTLGPARSCGEQVAVRCVSV